VAGTPAAACRGFAREGHGHRRVVCGGLAREDLRSTCRAGGIGRTLGCGADIVAMPGTALPHCCAARGLQCAICAF